MLGRLRGELRQPRVAGEGDRAPEPFALFLGKVGENGEEVELVAATEVECLEEKQDFGDNGGQTPRRLPNAVSYRQADTRLARQNPVVSGALVELDVQAEALISRSVDAVWHSLARVEAAVDVAGQTEGPAVPWLGRAAVNVGIMRDQLPAGEVIEKRTLILDEYRDIDVAVFASVAAEPGVDRPAPADRPRSGKRGHELRDGGDWFGYAIRRMA